MPLVSKAEAFLGSNKKVCLGAAKFASIVIGATGFPGAGLVSSVMDKVVELVATATDNVELCKRLVKKVWVCDNALGRNVPPKVLKLVQFEDLLNNLKTALDRTCAFVEDYGHNSSAVGRTVRANPIKEELDECCTILSDAMLDISLVLSFGLASVFDIQSLNADASKAAQSRALSDAYYLQEWWKSAIGVGVNNVPARMFLERLVKWYSVNEHDLKLSPLSYFDDNIIMCENLDLPALSELPDVPGMEGCKTELPSPVFLKHVVVSLLDDNRDGKSQLLSVFLVICQLEPASIGLPGHLLARAS
eukprot:gene32772-33835_t